MSSSFDNSIFSKIKKGKYYPTFATQFLQHRLAGQLISPSIFTFDETVTLALHSIPPHSFLKITSDQSAEQSEKLDVRTGRGGRGEARVDRIDRWTNRDRDRPRSKHLLELDARCLRQTLQLNIREWRVDWINLHCRTKRTSSVYNGVRFHENYIRNRKFTSNQ